MVFKGTPLTNAIHHNDIPLVKKLITEGADVNEVDGWCHYPLIKAIYNENVEVVKILLSHPDINIEKRDLEWGATPFMSAALMRNIEIAKLLIDAGANIHSKTENKQCYIQNIFEYMVTTHWCDDDETEEAINKSEKMINFLKSIGL